MNQLDPHSYFEAGQPRVLHLQLQIDVSFARRTLAGRVVLELQKPSCGPLDLDTKDLTIYTVRSERGVDLPFELHDEEPILGRRLRLMLPAGTQRVAIQYETAPNAIALQWLEPRQTEGGRHPFLFSQCQAIHARTMLPLQDTPQARITYEAEVTVPETLTAVMSAGPAGSRPGLRAATRTFLFHLPQPIPPYLLALAVGEFQSCDLSPRSRIWAEPDTLGAAAFEFANTETMLVAAEQLFGPYEWERYDMLVLPPSFPYGGMENPRMTFLTPTLLAGDRSLVNVVVHELAHAWAGNLVTNASMEHFWLNEGVTVWAERRIIEALNGEAAAVLDWAIGQSVLNNELARLGAGSPLTRLRQNLQGIDPDEAFSLIPYEKGARFLVLLERSVGRDHFDAFMRDYMARFRFTSITSEEFLAFLEEKLPGIAAQVDARAWLYEPGLPSNAPVFHSPALERLTALAERWSAGARPTPDELRSWKPAQMLVYLQRLPRQLDHASCEWLDARLELSARGNYELLVEWLTIAGGSDYEPALPRLREALMRVGRMKYLRPLYGALGKHARTRALAREIFTVAGPKYHILSRRLVESVIAAYLD
jgi:leukotriene-A4 hydrolase